MTTDPTNQQADQPPSQPTAQPNPPPASPNASSLRRMPSVNSTIASPGLRRISTSSIRGSSVTPISVP